MTVPDNRREFLLGQIRTAALRGRLLVNEYDTVGVALKGNLITPENAVAWLNDIGAGEMFWLPAEAA